MLQHLGGYYRRKFICGVVDWYIQGGGRVKEIRNLVHIIQEGGDLEDGNVPLSPSFGLQMLDQS